MKKPKLTFIIPIYNGEKYIENCLSNIFSQTFQETEIICINDGSTDGSLELLKKYKTKIRIIDQNNSGVWVARKNGIKVATGKYICFMDCDDEIEKNYAEELYNTIEKNKSDMAVCAFLREDLDSGKVLSVEMTKFENSVIELDSNVDKVSLINTSLWNKIYKTEKLKKHKNISSPPKVAEDAMFLLLLYPNIKTIAFNKKPLYHYKVHSKSAMSNFSQNEIDKIKSVFKEIKEYYNSINVNQSLLELLNLIAFIQIGIAVPSKFSRLNNTEYRKLIKDNYIFLNKEFKNWAKSKVLNFNYIFKSNFKTLKLYISKVFYKLGLLLLMLKIYNFVIHKLKIDIKW